MALLAWKQNFVALNEEVAALQQRSNEAAAALAVKQVSVFIECYLSTFLACIVGNRCPRLKELL